MQHPVNAEHGLPADFHIIPLVNRNRFRLSPRRLRFGLITGCIAAICALICIAAQLFSQTRLALSDTLYTSGPLSDRIVIVAIDDQSLGAYGRSVATWPRKLHGELLSMLANNGARVVTFDVLFADPSETDSTFAGAITQARANGTRTVLAAAAKQGGTVDFTGDTIHYSEMLVPVDSLRQAASMIGHVNVFADEDSYVRKIPVEVTDPQQMWLSLSAATYLAYLRIPQNAVSQVVKRNGDVFELTAQRQIPVDADGQMTTNFFGPARSFPIFSYRAVHDGEVDPAVFKDKIVLIGALNATGVTDRYFVPLSREEPMSGVEVHASAIETLLQNRPIFTQQPWSSALVVMALSLTTGVVFAHQRWYRVIIGYIAILIIGFLIASVLFSTHQFQMILFYPLVAVTLVMLITLFANIQWEIQRRQRTQRLLNSITRLGERRLVLNHILQATLNEISGLGHSDNATIWLWNDGLELASDAQQFSTPPPDDQTKLAQYAIELRQPLRSHDAVAIPMFFQNHPIGVIGLSGHGATTSIRNIRTLAQFAERAAPLLSSSALYTKQLKQQELIETVLTNTPSPILVLDAHTRLVRLNMAAAEVFTVSPDYRQSAGDTTPLTLDALLEKAGLSDEGFSVLMPVLEAGDSVRQEVTLGNKTYILQAAPMPLSDGGQIVVLQDVTSLKELDTLKTHMLRMVAHDLKNPIGVIIGYADLLREIVPLSPEQEPYLEAISTRGHHALTIITDLLNVERMKAGHLDLAPVEFKLMMTDIVEQYRAQAVEKQITLNLDMSGLPSPLAFHADKGQLREAISNLVGNALKYTLAEGTVTVEATQTRPSKITLRIIDTGIGIPANAMPKLFQPFFRVRDRNTAHIEGTGLGLSLAKAVIEAHRGNIRVESEVGKGTKFTVELPL